VEFTPGQNPGHGFEGDKSDRQSHRADGRDADLPAIAQLDHLGARLLLDGVLSLRRSAGAPVAEDRAAGGGRRTGEKGRGRVKVSTQRCLIGASVCYIRAYYIEGRVKI